MKLFEITERSILTVMGQQPLHVDGHFYCSDNNLTSLAGAPQSVGRNFNCSGNNLTSLAGAPQSVGRDFYCSDSNLTSLAGAPQSVGRDFDVSYNKITSFHDVHKIIKQINGTFYCDKGKDMLSIALIKGVKQVYIINDDKLTEIFNQYLHDVVLLQDALYDAGYQEQARL